MKGANQIPPGVEVRALLKQGLARRLDRIDLPPEVKSFVKKRAARSGLHAWLPKRRGTVGN
jgi:hypothetical protein